MCQKESVFSDLNNLAVITTTSEQYADCFGFTEEEVFSALDAFGMSEKKQIVKQWYDGFIFWSEAGYLQSLVNYELSEGKETKAILGGNKF